MLKSITRAFYHDLIYTTEPELFYEIYKWNCGLFTFLALRKILAAILFGAIGIIWLIFFNPKIYGLIFIDAFLLLLFIELKSIQKSSNINNSGTKTPKNMRTIKFQQFIRKFITCNGKALGRKEWKTIKKQDIELYNDLLCDNCEHICYHYSLKIAKIIKDSTLIWGGIEDPFKDGHVYYAHAVILRNNYVYDSNLHQSISYADFIKLYKFKLYKKWSYDNYSQNHFRDSERKEFRNWCEKNKITGYKYF